MARRHFNAERFDIVALAVVDFHSLTGDVCVIVREDTVLWGDRIGSLQADCSRGISLSDRIRGCLRRSFWNKTYEKNLRDPPVVWKWEPLGVGRRPSKSQECHAQGLPAPVQSALGT